MRLAGQTAALTKAHFVEAYGAPLVTIGLGGSGRGGCSSTCLRRTSPACWIAASRLQSYPDMVTQTIPISDALC